MAPEAEFAAYLASVPVDDEPLTPEEIVSLREGHAAAARGEFAPPDEVAAVVLGSSQATAGK